MADPGSPLHVFRFGEDDRMYVHGEEVVMARDLARLRKALLWIATYGSNDGDLLDDHEGAMRNIARNSLGGSVLIPDVLFKPCDCLTLGTRPEATGTKLTVARMSV